MKQLFLALGLGLILILTGFGLAQTAEADLSVTLSAPPAPVHVGQTVHYQISLRNHGPLMATGARFTTTLPLAEIANDTLTCQPLDNQTICQLNRPLPPGGNFELDLDFTLRGQGTTDYRVETSANETDPRPGNNIAVSRLSGQAATANILISRSQPRGKSPLVYTLYIHNDGPDPAFGVVVTEHLPPGSRIQAISAHSCYPTDNMVICSMDKLNAHTTISFTLWITSPETTPWIGAATIAETVDNTLTVWKEADGISRIYLPTVLKGPQ